MCIESQDGKFPDKLEDGYVEVVLASHFALARMFTKLVPPSREAVVSNMQRALDLYKWFAVLRFLHCLASVLFIVCL